MQKSNEAIKEKKSVQMEDGILTRVGDENELIVRKFNH